MIVRPISTLVDMIVIIFSWLILTGLVFSEYLISGQAPPVKEVNDEEPLFPAVPILNVKPFTTVCYFFFFELVSSLWEWVTAFKF